MRVIHLNPGTASTFTEGLWDKVLTEMKAGDSVLVQFGHNDGGPLDTGRARGSLPGTGDETQEITTPGGNRETVHSYGWYIRKYIADVKVRKATPIILSLKGSLIAPYKSGARQYCNHTVGCAVLNGAAELSGPGELTARTTYTKTNWATD